MANIINNYSSTIVTIFKDVLYTYENNQAEIKRIEESLNDVYHEAELSPNKDLYGGYKIYKSIRELRQRRRTLKNEQELLKDMYEFMKTQPAQQFKSKIQSIQGEAAKVYNAQEKRTYTPRQRDDLTIAGKTQPVEAPPFEELIQKFNETKVTSSKGKLRK